MKYGVWFFCFIFLNTSVAALEKSGESLRLTKSSESLKQTRDVCVITSDGIEFVGKTNSLIKVTDTPKIIRAKIPSVSFKDVQDHDGIDYVEIKYQENRMWFIEDMLIRVVYDGGKTACATKEGVKPGMSIKEAEKIYGKVIAVEKNGANIYEDIIFKKNPKHIRFIGLPGTGIFEKDFPEKVDDYTTKKYDPEAEINRIQVSNPNPDDCCK
jgi:hypothetical protein